MTTYFDASILAFGMEIDHDCFGGPPVPESLQAILALNYSVLFLTEGHSDVDSFIPF
jgi:hypothetical protein